MIHKTSLGEVFCPYLKIVHAAKYKLVVDVPWISRRYIVGKYLAAIFDVKQLVQ